MKLKPKQIFQQNSTEKIRFKSETQQYHSTNKALQHLSKDLAKFKLNTQMRQKRGPKNNQKYKRLRNIESQLSHIKKYLQSEVKQKKQSINLDKYPKIYFQPILFPVPAFNFGNASNLILKQVKSERSSCICELNNSPANLRNSQTNNKTKQKDQIVQKKIKKRNVSRLFKYWGIIVYFCLIFPKFCKKFTKNRLKWFTNRYQSENCLLKQTQQVVEKLYNINIFNIYKNSIITKSDIQYPIVKFINQFMSQIKNIITEKKFLANFHELFSVGILNKHFIIQYQKQYLYFPQEKQFLIPGKTVKKGNLLILDNETQFCLIFIRVFIKIIIYNYLKIVIKNKKFLIKKIYRQGKYDQSFDQQQINQMVQFVEIFAIYLHQVCVEMYKEGLNHFKEKQKEKIMIYNRDNSKKKSSSFKSQLRKSYINFTTQKSIITQNSTEKQNEVQQPFQYLKSMKNYQQLSRKIQKSKILQDFKNQMIDNIIDFVMQIQNRVKEQEKYFYKYIWDLALQQKYLLNETIHQIKNTKIQRRLRSHQRVQSLNSNENLKSIIDMENIKTQRSILKKKSCINMNKDKSSSNLYQNLPIIKQKQYMPTHSKRRLRTIMDIPMSSHTLQSQYINSQSKLSYLKSQRF